MTPEGAAQAVADGATVRLLNAHNRYQYAVGRAISYSLVPTITIELSSGGSHISWRHDLAEVVRPPKPKEPTGLGAVVRERHEHDGVDWVRVPLASNDERWFCGDTGEWRAYADIDVVKVLSEGVAP